jgi:hypothetical protein
MKAIYIGSLAGAGLIVIGRNTLIEPTWSGFSAPSQSPQQD